MVKEQVIIIGGGPCGLAAAIALKENGLDPLIIEKGNITNAIYHYPTHQTFFSTSEKLEIGAVPFIINERKPNRLQALAYYREVVNRKRLRIHTYETVEKADQRPDGSFSIETKRQNDGKRVRYQAKFVIVATGYYDNPNKLDVPGADSSKVYHYFKEGHPYHHTDVAVLGGKNSAVDAALELEKSGARVTVLYRGKEYSGSIKPWILPEFEALVRNGKVLMEFNATVEEIRPDSVVYVADGQRKTIPNDFVFAMIGYHPDHSFLTRMGVGIEEGTGRPLFNEETMETNMSGVFIAGVIAAGNNANEIFIENGRYHGEAIAREIAKRMN